MSPNQAVPAALPAVFPLFHPEHTHAFDIPRINLSRAGRFFTIFVLEQFDPLRQPARGTRNRKQHRKHIDRETHRLVNNARNRNQRSDRAGASRSTRLQGNSFQLQRDIEHWILAR